MNSNTPTHFNVYSVEEYETDGGKKRSWLKVGVAFPHKEGPGFNLQLRALPVDGKLVMLPPDQDAAAEDRTPPAPAPAREAQAPRRSVSR